LNSDLHVALERTGAQQDSIFTLQLDSARRSSSGSLSELSISVKDNIDVAGVTTTAASVAFRSRPPAKEDAPVVKRLRAAGALVFAKTNMSEFAYSTLGVNAHYGTPTNPHPFEGGPRIPGGSSSGAAVAVALGLGCAAIGTDTAGSARIPAALCGVVGFKPRQRRIPLDGVVPVSFSYDCIGILAQSVRKIARVFESIADAADDCSVPRTAGKPYRLLIPIEVPDAAFAPEDDVGEAFCAAVDTLSADRRFEIVRQPFDVFRDALTMSAKGGIAAPEAYAFHKPFLQTLRDLYDPFTLYRLSFGEKCSAERYINLLARRRELIAESLAQLSPFDAVLYPTCPIIAPSVASLADPAVKANTNMRLLQNTIAANVLDLASITVPCGHLAASEVGPVGLSLDSCHGEEQVLRLAHDIEQVLGSKFASES
jgi:aspartyl-tRNA(Asn)/glutamyl-tRNA(Gln) amidotransferase subunit A